MKTILIGSSRSGISLLSGILDCSPNASISPIDFHHICKARPKYNYPIPTSSTVGIVSITPQLIQDYGVTILDALYALKYTTSLKFIWVVRNPLISSASCVKKFAMTAGDSLEFWNISNICLWYFFSSLTINRKMVVKYEDILLNPKVVKGAFDVIEEQYSDQYLRYGDFDHDYINCPIFSKGFIDTERVDPHNKSEFLEIWNKYKNSKVVIDMGYNYDFD